MSENHKNTEGSGPTHCGHGWRLDMECERCGDDPLPERMAVEYPALRVERDALRAEKDDALRLVAYWHRKYDDRRENEDALIERVMTLEAALRKIVAGPFGDERGFFNLEDIKILARDALVKP